MKILGFVIAVGVVGSAATAGAEKSNEIRPTPSPITTVGLAPGHWVVAPRLVYARYRDTLTVPDLPGQTQEYAIDSLGVAIEGQHAFAERLAVHLGVEAYQKLGSITGPSPGDFSKRTRADVTGNAFKVAAQANFKVFHFERGGDEPTPGELSVYAFGRVLGDLFAQEQVEPLFRTDFSERSLEYRLGAAAHVYLWRGLFVAGFGGVEGVRFSGEREDTVTGGAAQVASISGGDAPYPFFGADLLWAPPFLGRGFEDAVSLGAILALNREDETGFGGKVLTFNLGYSVHFGGAAPPPAEAKAAPDAAPAPAVEPAAPPPVLPAPAP
ncbi:MAG: hypothetical protein HY903_12560 [Deltaproteobacteria bacterium]|nr:hypothetical protein [Deltaproteobacteria bacterium]